MAVKTIDKNQILKRIFVWTHTGKVAENNFLLIIKNLMQT